MSNLQAILRRNVIHHHHAVELLHGEKYGMDQQKLNAIISQNMWLPGDAEQVRNIILNHVSISKMYLLALLAKLESRKGIINKVEHFDEESLGEPFSEGDDEPSSILYPPDSVEYHVFAILRKYPINADISSEILKSNIQALSHCARFINIPDGKVPIDECRIIADKIKSMTNSNDIRTKRNDVVTMINDHIGKIQNEISKRDQPGPASFFSFS